MRIEHLPKDTAGETVGGLLKRDGAVIVDEVISTGETDALIAELKPWMDATPLGLDDFSGRRTKRTGGLVARSPLCRDLIMHPLVLDAKQSRLATPQVFSCT